MKNQLSLGCRDLQDSLKRIQTHLAWLDLVKAEKAGRGPDSPRFNDATKEELQNEIAWFYHTYLRIYDWVRKLPESSRPLWQDRIRHLWQQYRHALNRYTTMVAPE